MLSGEISAIIFLIVSAICSITDVKKRHIDNRVLMAGTAASAISFFITGTHVDMRALVYMLLFVLVLFFTFIMRMMGGGDIKLYAFLCFSIPNETGLKILVLSMVMSAFYGAFRLVADFAVNIKPDIKNLGFIKNYNNSKTANDRRNYALAIRRGQGIPMALFIFMAALMVMIKEGGIKWIG